MPRPRQIPPLEPETRQNEPDTGRTFTQKLGIYLTGIAIGLMFLGWTQYRKGMAARQQRSAQTTPLPGSEPTVDAAIPPTDASDTTPPDEPEKDAVDPADVSSDPD